jgi:hypothetical protein
MLVVYTVPGDMVACEALFALSHKASFDAHSRRNASGLTSGAGSMGAGQVLGFGTPGACSAAVRPLTPNVALVRTPLTAFAASSHLLGL